MTIRGGIKSRIAHRHRSSCIREHFPWFFDKVQVKMFFGQNFPLKMENDKTIFLDDDNCLYKWQIIEEKHTFGWCQLPLQVTNN